MIESLLNRPFPRHIRLKQDIPYFIEFNHPYQNEPWVCTLKTGEIAEYFGHTDCYCFDGRNGMTPFFSRLVLARLPDFIEVIDE